MKSVLGIDIGGTQIKAARVDADGHVLGSRRLATPDSLDAVGAAARQLVDELGQGVSAAGIGCKGIIDPKTTRVAVLPGTLHYLEGHLLSDLFAVPGMAVFADNDARVALVGERRWGAARGHENVLMLTLGTGVGGAVLSHGRIVRGAGGAGGHIGHLTVNPDGERCICGNHGCLETVFSSRAIESAAFAAIHRGVASRLLDGPKPPDCERVFALAREGDAVAREIIERSTHVLAAAIAGLVFVLDPEIIVLGGQIAIAGEFLLHPLRTEVLARTIGMLRREVPIVGTGLDDPSGVLGAAALALDYLTVAR
ncbi:MAG: ROK family protein [Acidobacteria bacterium]|nr:ROK family protein [Acidobacteriota bacterium]